LLDHNAPHPDVTVKQQQYEQRNEQQGGSRTELLPKKQIQQLFDVFLQRSSIAKADSITMSTAMYAATALALPVKLDDLNWVSSAYMARVDEAGATSAALMMYAITMLHRAALLQPSSSSSRGAAAAGGSWGGGCLDAAHADSLVPMLVQLTQVSAVI
jgi:hypothetical protein